MVRGSDLLPKKESFHASNRLNTRVPYMKGYLQIKMEGADYTATCVLVIKKYLNFSAEEAKVLIIIPWDVSTR